MEGLCFMKRLWICLISVVLLFNLYSAAAFAEEKKSTLAEDSLSAILIERDTGAVLFEKNSDEKLPPASMTKIMTMILIMEALENGKISITDKVRTSEFAASMGGSQIFLEPGEEMTVEEMFKGIAIGSANDASVAMGEFIAGTNDDFVEMMNAKAKELGLKNTRFQNPTGLPAKDHYTTAHDMAVMAKELLKYSKVTQYTGQYEDYLRQDTDKKFWLVNTNRLVKFYPGVDGLKTGYTNEAKYCLTATAQKTKDGMRVIAVVMGAPTAKDRNRQITELFDFAFSQYTTKRLYERHQKIEQVIVDKGSKRHLDIVTSEPVSLLLKKGNKDVNVTTELEMNTIKTPVKKGDEIGTLMVRNNGKNVTESPVLASEDIGNASWWTLFKRTIGQFAKSPAN
jgi:D-alanyl-D-alanine carboxypeptidase (penicillin-binding protein 5/6)